MKELKKLLISVFGDFGISFGNSQRQLTTSRNQKIRNICK